jgi:CTD kinase subunit beta
MLESAGFDFRSRDPQTLMVKLARALDFDQNNEAKTAWNLSLDLYRTFAPLKQSTATLAIACLELAARLHTMDTGRLVDAGVVRYSKWSTSRAEIMETLLDLLDLYTHHRASSAVGPLYPLETFNNIRIGLNQEASVAKIPRYASYASEGTVKAQNGSNGSKPRNGAHPKTSATPAIQTPASAMGSHGQDVTVRFMLDAARARAERSEVDKYHQIEQEEYEVEVPVETRVDDRDRRSRVR